MNKDLTKAVIAKLATMTEEDRKAVLEAADLIAAFGGPDAAARYVIAAR